MARWHKDHNDFVDCEVLEVLTRGKSPRHGTLLIRIAKKKPQEVPAHQIYDWDPAEFEPKPEPEPDERGGDDSPDEGNAGQDD